MTNETDLMSDPRIATIRDQLKASLKAGGVFEHEAIAANIEGMIVAHILRLVEKGLQIKVEGTN